VLEPLNLSVKSPRGHLDDGACAHRNLMNQGQEHQMSVDTSGAVEPIRPASRGSSPRERLAGGNQFLRDRGELWSASLANRRRTRIVATIGPASQDPDTLIALERAGMDVARVPFAHGPLEDSIERVRAVRKILPTMAILADVPGPKVRIAPVSSDGIELHPGQETLLVAGDPDECSTRDRIVVMIDEKLLNLSPGDVIAFGDGGVAVVVLEAAAGGARSVVRNGGRLLGRPGVTLPATVPLLAPTAADITATEALAHEEIDFIAVSFVRSAADILAIRTALGTSTAMICPKIEMPEAFDNLEGLLEVSDAIMVARGDLGLRLPLEQVPYVQKMIIRNGVRFGRPVITATQMLESMTYTAVPTRAEVNDVANAVLDGTSAVMLSGETAIGAHPVIAVETMARIITFTESYFDFVRWGNELGIQQLDADPGSPARVTAALTGAAWRAAMEQGVAAIVVCTRTGSTARAISRFRPPMPIIAATPRPETARQLALSWGVETLVVAEATHLDDVIKTAIAAAAAAGKIKSGDVIAVVAGPPDDREPITDTLRILQVG
jgi:pyruvate kinase